MTADDRLDELAGSVLEGRPVDWDLVETGSVDSGEEAGVRGLRDVERVVRYSRNLQRQPGSPAVTPPESWGHLVLLERAGAGQSGEIWRAWDAWLQREVALKFLLTVDDAADDRALLEEARALARVRHPGVVAVHGLAEHDGRIGMWMELLSGDTLEVEIARRGQLPANQVAHIGVELSRALEAIGAAGLVHRDIKPANIVLESSGRLVLTDFGLGRRMSLSDRELRRSSGTPIFMSPERLAGEPATPRSDIYALGVTLRWALTGRCPFEARTLEELKRMVDAGPAVPLGRECPDAPPILIDAIERAMAARVESRFSVAEQLTQRLEQALIETNAKVRARTKRRRLTSMAGIVVLATISGLLLFHALNRPAPSHPARFTVTPPMGMSLDPSSVDPVVSPDGRLVVFSALDSAGMWRLFVRPLESLTARLLVGTEEGIIPFWSPDSRYIGFFAHSKLKKIPVSGGPPEVICSAPDARGGAWGKDGVIVFAPNVAGPLCRVSAEGGAVTEIQRPDSARHETALRWPQFLPDGKRFFFVALPPRDGAFDVFVASPDSKGRRRVMSGGCAPICAGTKGIIVASNGRLMFQKFDFRRLRPVGSPVALGIAPFSDVSVGQPLASASRNGVLAHASEKVTNTNIFWVDRSGNRIGRLPLDQGRYEKLFFAPDGKRVLAERRNSPTTVDLWLIDLESGESRRFSQGSQTRIGGAAVWSPDGRRIAFNSNRSGRTYVYQRLVDQPGEEQLLYQSSGQFNEVLAWSPDGRYLVMQQTAEGTGWDLWLLPLGGAHEATPYVRTRFGELGATISPDGRWMAYSTDAAGKHEIHTRSFPQPGIEHLVAGIRGAPFWTSGGRDLLALDIVGVWSVPVSTTPTFQAGSPRLLFRRRPNAMWCMPAPDGRRFLEITPDESDEPRSITVDVNFLERLAP